MSEKILRNDEAIEIYDRIKETPIFDIHTHLNYKKPCMRSAWDLVSYHYFTEMAHSMGFSLDEVENDEDGVRRIFEYLPAMRTTAPYLWLEQIAQKFFNCDIGDWKEFYESVEKHVSSKGWMKEVIRSSGIERIALTNSPWESFEGLDRGLFFPTFRADPLMSFDGRIVRGTYAETEALLEERLNYFVSNGCRAAAISTPEDLRYVSSARRDNGVLKTAVEGKASEGEKNEARSALLSMLASLCGEKKLPFEIMFGSVRNVYKRCVPEGGDFSRADLSLLSIADLFNDHPDVIFPVSVVSFTNDQELAEFARLFDNVYASGHWWFTNTESAIETALKKRLEISPHKKHIGYYSDAYTMELIWAKFDFYRRVESNVFADLVREKRLTLNEAVEFIRTRDYETPKRLFS